MPAPAPISFHGYEGCILLENADTRVVLGPHVGGRVLEYSWKGANVLMLDPAQDGWVDDPTQRRKDPCGGRFDIGPEREVPEHRALWTGPWQAEATGPRTARMTSVEDAATGVQLVRDFALADDSSHLRCTQTIRNVSDHPVPMCHWSRTWAVTGGACVVPLTPAASRFPNGYIMYRRRQGVDHAPVDPQIAQRGEFLVIAGPPDSPKLGMDTYAGWLAYLAPNDLLFVKRFAAPADRTYGGPDAITMSIFYCDQFVELEPIGPMEEIAPGGTASYTEDWWLLERAFPGSSEAADPDAIAAQVQSQAR